MSRATIVAPTVTKLPPGTRGAVLLTGSHGGRYAGRCALLAGVRAAVFHDAGIGRDEAGVASLAVFDARGIPAAAVSHDSARIGDTDDMRARGRLSRVNAAAAALGLRPGMGVPEALALLQGAALRDAAAPEAAEARTVLDLPGASRRIVLIDSVSLVQPEQDRGAILVTGSHGGLVGGDPATALRADGFGAVFNDAGIGIDQAGLGRLAALEARGIAALTAAAASARIGEARSSFEDGVVSAVNPQAAALGARVGKPVRDAVLRWAGWADRPPGSQNSIVVASAGRAL